MFSSLEELPSSFRTQQFLKTNVFVSEDLVTEKINSHHRRYDLLSLQNIVIMANEYLKKEIGSWFRSTTLVMTLEAIFRKVKDFE